MATYGTPNIQALTRASRAFTTRRRWSLARTPSLAAWRDLRGGARPAGSAERAYRRCPCGIPNVEWVDKPALLAQLPCLKPEAVAAGMSEPEAADIDVHALHQGYLRGLRQWGGQVLTQAEVVGLQKKGMPGTWRWPMADIAGSTIVNAAGAWADVVAAMAGVPPARDWSRAGAPLSRLPCLRGWTPAIGLP